MFKLQRAFANLCQWADFWSGPRVWSALGRLTLGMQNAIKHNSLIQFGFGLMNNAIKINVVDHGGAQRSFGRWKSTKYAIQHMVFDRNELVFFKNTMFFYDSVIDANARTCRFLQKTRRFLKTLAPSSICWKIQGFYNIMHDFLQTHNVFSMFFCRSAQTWYPNVNIYLVKLHITTQNVQITKGIR